MKGEFYKMEFREWNLGTVDLTLEQEAAYLRLCHAMYDVRGPVPNSTRFLQGIFRCGNTKAAALLRALIDAKKIAVTSDNRLYNHRVADELSDRERVSKARRVAGERGGSAPRAKSDRSGTEPRAMPERCRGDALTNPERCPSDAVADLDKALKNKEADEAIALGAGSRGEEIRGEKSREEEEVSPEKTEFDDALDGEPPSDRRGRSYAFEAGVIRLNKRDYDRWEKAYPHLNLRGVLLAKAQWAETTGNWFFALPQLLSKMDEEARLAVERIRAEAAAVANAPKRPVHWTP